MEDTPFFSLLVVKLWKHLPKYPCVLKMGGVMNLPIPRRVEHGLGPAPASPKKTMKYGVMVRWLGGVGKIMLLVKSEPIRQ